MPKLISIELTLITARVVRWIKQRVTWRNASSCQLTPISPRRRKTCWRGSESPLLFLLQRGVSLSHLTVKVDHGDFDDVGRGALHWHVYCHPLGSFSDLPVWRVDFRYVTPPAHHRLHAAPLSGLAFGGFDIFFDFGIFLEVSAYELCRFLSAETG